MPAVTRPYDHVLVLFGATGDLAKRMLLPGLYRLAVSGLLPARCRIIGSAPAAVVLSDDAFRRHLRDAVTEFGNVPAEGAPWKSFEQALFFAAADPGDPSPLVAAVGSAEQAIGGDGDELVIDFSDPGTIEAAFLPKEPGPPMRLGQATMTFRYGQSCAMANGLAGYERLILGGMVGDQPLFTDAESIERLWEVSAPVLDHSPLLEACARGSWGPSSIAKVAAPHRWHLSAPKR